MTLEKSIEAYGTPEFAAVLSDEIEQYSDDIPVEDLMDNGGWLTDNVEVGVTKFEDDGKIITAKIKVYFDEDHPSGCANITRTDHYTADFTVRIDMETGDAEFDLEGGENTTHDKDVEEMNFDERAEYDHDNSDF